MAWKASDFSDTTGWKPEDFSDEYGNKPTSKVKPNKNALPYKAALKPKETAKSKETTKPNKLPATPFSSAPPRPTALKETNETVKPLPSNGSIMSEDTFFKNLSPQAKLSYTKNKLINNLKNTALNFGYGVAKNVAAPLDPLLDALTVTREEKAIANKETPEQIETAKRMDFLDAQNEERKFKKIPNQSWTRDDMTGFEKGTETAGGVAGEVFKNIYGYAAATPLSGAIPLVKKINNPFVRAIVADQIADNLVQTPGKIVSGIANKENPLDVVKDISIQNAVDLGMNVVTGGAIEGIDKLKEFKAVKKVDAKMQKYVDDGIFGAAKNTAKEAPKTLPINQSILKPIQEQPSVKPTTLNKSLNLKNKALETAYKRLEDGIKKAQDYYGTNELRVGEIEKFKADTGIDLNTLANDYAIQSSKTKQQVFNEIASKSKYKRISGLGNKNTYKTLETVAKQGERKPTLSIDKQTYEVNSLVNNSKLKPVSNSLVNNQKIKPISTPAKYNSGIETKIKTAKDNESVGTLGDYLQGENVRELYNDVLDTPIKVTDKKNIVNGALAESNGKPLIIVNKNAENIEDTILEEASHAMREAKGRTNLSLDGATQAKAGQYETLPFEKSASKMVEHAKMLDNIPGESGQFKKLKLEQSVKNSDQFSKEVKNKVGGDYQVKGNDQLVKDAEKLIKSDLEYAKQMAKSEKVNSDMSNEVARQLIHKAQKEGKWDEVIEIIEATSKKAMESGRAVQALSLWGRMTPEGMLKYAQSVIDRANGKLAKANPKEFEKIRSEFKKKGEDIKYYSLNPRQSKMAKVIQLTSSDAKHINDQMVKINQMADGRPKEVEIAKTLDYIAAKIPPSLLQQVSTFQTMAQLLNAKTALRNTLGNFGFQVLENLSDTLGTGMDKFVGAFTKERTKFLPSLKTQALGMKKGFSLGLEDALKGIDTSGISTQMDLPSRTFRTGFFGGLEKVMNIELRATDRAFYQSAFDQSLRNQIKAKKISFDKVTNEMIEQAHLDGLYKTFQDKNVLSTVFSKIKNGLNAGKEFGFGDLVMKYPKTPANLLMRGIDYSPLGIAKETFNLAKNGFNQKRFVESLSRAAVGTGLLGSGVLLYNLGILQGKKASDKEAYALMEETGAKQYTVNLSALKRFTMSGMNSDYAKRQDGDMMVNYDWIQPAALPITAGTNIAQQKSDKKNVTAGDLLGATIYSLSAGVDTLAEQPLVQNFAKLFRGYDIKESGANVLKDIPASFVPTFVNQVRQMVDNTSRDSYEDGAYGFKEALNRVMYKMPGLSNKLPERVTTTGNTKQTYQDNSNNAFNVFLNPAFVTKYKSSEGMQTILNLYEETGETKQFPRQVSKTMTINGEKYTLSKDEVNALQKEIGKNVMEQVNKMPRNAPNEVLIDRIVNILDIEGKRAKGKFKSNLHQSNTK